MGSQRQGSHISGTKAFRADQAKEAFEQIVIDLGVSDSEKQIWSDIITRESGWNVYATNPSSGAYGLPQSLPGNKMASVGDDYLTNPYTQLMWMYKYVHERYGRKIRIFRQCKLVLSWLVLKKTLRGLFLFVIID